MHSESATHLARVTPIDSGESMRVMNRFSLLSNSAALLLFQTVWIWFAILGACLMMGSSDLMSRFGLFSWQLAVVLLAMQLGLLFVYPEWPVNLLLCRRLRRAIATRSDRLSWAKQNNARVVELVPRERWRKNSFETATDLLLIRVDASGVLLEGDCDRYEMPADSILNAEFHAFRPPGWITSTNMVVITARTMDGPIEVPISYRDHRYGTLRSSRRRDDAIALVNQINAIAHGSQFQFSTPLEPSNTAARPERSSNPYAAPALLWD
ncbi:MAG: hypothetical protein HKN47_27145 [Pirellulaceae bacterium]|nr:hypothetical protein [Pirellulaceae bacterium]